MAKILVKLFKNKSNGQVNLSIPKKKLSIDIKSKMSKAKKVWLSFEGFE